MTIKTVSTWLKTAHIPENLLEDRGQFTLPTELANRLKRWEDEGKRPTTRQPEESIVVTDSHIIVTVVWFDEGAAQEWVDLGHNNPNIPELVSRVLVID